MENKKTIKMKINFWQITTIILFIALVLSLYTNYTGRFLFINLNYLNLEEIGKKTVDYINKYFVQPGTSAKLKEVKFDSSLNLYIVITEYQGNEIPVYVSSNGKYIVGFNQVFDMDKPLRIEREEAKPQEIPKSDRPKVELFIFSYCPYGVQALKPFASVAKLMKDYADFYVKFFSHMHGEFEKQQNIIQACIIRMYPEKYWDYAIKFADEVFRKCYGNKECDKNESIRIMNELGIDSNKILKCLESEGEKYYNEDIKDAENYGLTGSPSFVINGVYVRVVRSEEGIKEAVCQAFNIQPSICQEKLSEEITQSSGSC